MQAQLAACWADGEAVDFTQASVVASSAFSLVIRMTPGSASVVKVGAQQHIAHERELLLDLDGRSPHLRRMTAHARHAELRSGVLPGLAMLELDGFGEPLQSYHMEPNGLGVERVWDQAAAGLSAMHAAGLLHRDPKPSNLLVINGSVQLSDLDISCRTTDDIARQNLTVGTPEYQSPKLAQRYEERDDWLALALTMLKLEGINIEDKLCALQMACISSWVPDSMQTCIMQSLAD